MTPILRLCALTLILGLAAAMPLRSANADPRKIGHVFIIVLENEGYETTFGPKSPAKYLRSLATQGALLSNYYGIGHASLDNYIAMISGQAPNPATQGDCFTYEEFVSKGTAADGQEIGQGCVYPANVLTIANQLEVKGLSWKGYMGDMGNNPARESATCGHPALGEKDRTQFAEKGDQYAARHNPFVYFHAVIDSPSCTKRVVNARALADDLKHVDTTPNLAFITPNLCDDGHDGGERGKCVDGAPGGLISADAYLAKTVPQILDSPAFKEDGLLIITFDEAEMHGRYDKVKKTYKITSGDASACCNEKAGPNTGSGGMILGNPNRGPGIFGPGGGRIGAVLVSKFITPGTTSKRSYNHYSLLRTLENMFGVGHLGYAGQQGLKAFGSDVFAGGD